MEMVINISVIEESKYKQLWSRPETTQILLSSSYTKSYHPMLQLISLKKKEKEKRTTCTFCFYSYDYFNTHDLVKQNFVLLLRIYIATDPNIL